MSLKVEIEKRPNKVDGVEEKKWKDLFKDNPMSFNFLPSYLLENRDFLNESWEIIKASVQKTFNVNSRKAKVLAKEIIMQRFDAEMEKENSYQSQWRSMN